MTRATRLTCLVALLAAAAMTGCYRKVVGAQGFGADSATIERGNLGDDSRTLGYPKYSPKRLPGD